LELAAVIISIISLVVSSALGLWTLYQSKKTSKITLESEFLKEIYIDYLIRKIPNGRGRITYNSERKNLNSITELQTVLTNLRKDSLYFKFTDATYHKKLLLQISKLENLLMTEHLADQDSFNDIYEQINKSIEEIYTSMISKYTTGKYSRFKKRKKSSK